MTHEEYVQQKTKYAFELAQKDLYFEKARSIVIKDNKILAIHTLDNDKFTYPGGGVDEGETALEAAKREAFEESGVIVKPLRVIDEVFYDVPMEWKGQKFISKRVEKFVLCEFESFVKKEAGIDGEYSKGAEIEWLDKKEVGKISNTKEHTIKKIMNI